MAILVVNSDNFIEVALDGLTDFDSTADLVSLGLARNAVGGLNVKKITFVPSAVGDAVIVRDGENGPRMFVAEALGTHDVLKDEYGESGKIIRGKKTKPYIHANETVVSIVNQAYVIFELN